MDAISRIGPAFVPREGTSAAPGAGTAAAGAPGFADTLRDLVADAAARQAEAGARVERFAGAGPGELHEIAIAGSKAEIAFRLLVSVRNKLIDAYREVMRMGA